MMRLTLEIIPFDGSPKRAVALVEGDITRFPGEEVK